MDDLLSELRAPRTRLLAIEYCAEQFEQTLARHRGRVLLSRIANPSFLEALFRGDWPASFEPVSADICGLGWSEGKVSEREGQDRDQRRRTLHTRCGVSTASGSVTRFQLQLVFISTCKGADFHSRPFFFFSSACQPNLPRVDFRE